jgi:uncharacterized membrane protein YjgN (DUF898 family)
VVLFATYSFGGHFSPTLKIVFAIALAIALPWLIVRSLAFNAYNSAYRNIRLHFSGTYVECFKVIVLYGLLTVISLGLGYPYLKAHLIRFAARNQLEVGRHFCRAARRIDAQPKMIDVVEQDVAGHGHQIVGRPCWRMWSISLWTYGAIP